MGRGRIIEIGAMKVFGSEIDEKNHFHSLVNPKRLISEEATRINGITNEMVANAPTFERSFRSFSISSEVLGSWHRMPSSICRS